MQHCFAEFVCLQYAWWSVVICGIHAAWFYWDVRKFEVRFIFDNYSQIGNLTETPRKLMQSDRK